MNMLIQEMAAGAAAFPGVSRAVDSAAPAGFAEAIGRAAAEAVDAMRRTETVAMDGLAGRTGIQDVVESVMQAERSFSTALAVRDKIVTAILDVSRMQV
jgi:flagellar hook-basal body complex protein FliE